MIRYLLYDLLETCGGVSMCFGVKRLFTIHGLHRLPRKCWRGLRQLTAALARFVTARADTSRLTSPAQCTHTAGMSTATRPALGPSFPGRHGMA